MPVVELYHAVCHNHQKEAYRYGQHHCYQIKHYIAFAKEPINIADVGSIDFSDGYFFLSAFRIYLYGMVDSQMVISSDMMAQTMNRFRKTFKPST